MLSRSQSKFQQDLLKWYGKNARDLPWRRTKDPYKIWVSEIMLQQTQVDTVIPYYLKWLERFPTLKSLTTAPLDDAMKLWAGLGYYRRVRMLHEGAQYVLEELGGKIPADPEELGKLPGVGRYTAGAIASIAFDKRAPILDGNVIRVLTRLCAVKSDVSSTRTVAKLWQLAEELLPKKQTGDFNQALMELGAMVCAPDNPSCLFCPVSRYCAAYKAGQQSRYPVKAQKEQIEKKQTFALILRKEGKVLIQQQPEKARWGGLWMFPYYERRSSMLKAHGLQANALKRRMQVTHAFTKYRVTLDVYEAEAPAREAQEICEKSHKWVPLGNLKKHAFPSPHQKIVKDLEKHHG
ncbi:MAG: A/G-specific adenine glycosylase [Candidatus Omnitrophota bacterium]|nr:A/G-specific adenine glycosylase [Candidatus Omnitrophota bacterium]